MLAALAGPSSKIKQRSKSAVNQVHPESWATQLEIGEVKFVFSPREAQRVERDISSKEGNTRNHTLFYQMS